MGEIPQDVLDKIRSIDSNVRVGSLQRIHVDNYNEKLRMVEANLEYVLYDVLPESPAVRFYFLGEDGSQCKSYVSNHVKIDSLQKSIQSVIYWLNQVKITKTCVGNLVHALIQSIDSFATTNGKLSDQFYVPSEFIQDIKRFYCAVTSLLARYGLSDKILEQDGVSYVQLTDARIGWDTVTFYYFGWKRSDQNLHVTRLDFKSEIYPVQIATFMDIPDIIKLNTWDNIQCLKHFFVTGKVRAEVPEDTESEDPPLRSALVSLDKKLGRLKIADWAV